ncbi:MAG TPA: ParA family protein [Anaerolineae bacterium]|nr:ParA family protein [Anaerolineae bacterium]
MALTIAVSSQKGGVAKTTTTLSLGASLAEQGRSVLVVDLDPQANLTQSLGVDPGQLRRMIGDVLLDQATLLSISRESSVFNLDLAPANQGLLVLDKVLYGRQGYEYRLKTHLQSLNGGYYDVVILDCPPAFGTLTINALTAADLLIIPVSCDFYSARSLQTYLDLIRMVNHNSNSKLTYRLLVTMFDRRNRISHILLDQLKKAYGAVLFNTIIPLDVRLRESPVFGKPITQYAPSARGAQEYRALAGELLAPLAQPVVAHASA